MDYTFYKLQSKNPEITDFYIGSTENFTIRKQLHKSDCNNINYKNYNLKVYIFIRLNGGFENFEFEIIDVIKFTKTDALLHEQKLMNLYGSTLNVRKAIQTKEERIEYKKEYYLNHKEERIKYQKEYQLNNKEQKKEYNRKRYLQKKLNKILGLPKPK